MLIGIGCVLVVVQPWLSRRMAARRERLGITESAPHGSIGLWLAVMLTGVYGGYFGAAQGVLADRGARDRAGGARSSGSTRSRTCSPGWSTAIAGLIFVFLYHVNWWAAGAIAVGSVIGAQIGGRVGKKLPPLVYRIVIVVVGVVAIVNLFADCLPGGAPVRAALSQDCRLGAALAARGCRISTVRERGSLEGEWQGFGGGHGGDGGQR